MKNARAPWMLMLAVCAVLVCLRARAADSSVSVDWSQSTRSTSSLSFGLNFWHGSDPSVNGNATYKNNMSFMNPGIIRVHNAVMTNDSSQFAQGWTNDAARTWDAAKISQSIANIRSSNPNAEILINIPGFPTWMDTNNDGILDAGQEDNYAAFCAQLVQIVNQSGNGNYARYWEPTNEKDQQYSGNISALTTIWQKCYNAMKSVDNSIKVGGLGFANPYNYGNVQSFINATANQIDFVSIHNYLSSGNSTGISNADVYGETDGYDWVQGNTMNYIRGATSRNVPLFSDEYNINGNPDPYNPEPRMTSNVSAVFDALTMEKAAKNGTAGTMSWNERDGWFGKTDDSNTRRPASYLYNLVNQYFVGQIAASTSSTADLEALTVKSGSRASLMLINRSGTAHSVALSFQGWAAPSSSSNYTEYQISASGYATSTISYGTITSGVTVPANSVTMVVLPNVSFGSSPTPYGGSAASVPGTIQMENYDVGGEGISYHDADSGNNGGQYRSDAVDIESCSDTGGGYNVGWINSGEWAGYTINVASAGTYTLTARVASPNGGGPFHVEFGPIGQVGGGGIVSTTAINVPQTGGWQNWSDTSAVTVSLPAGRYWMRVVYDSGGFNINKITLVSGTVSSVPIGRRIALKASINGKFVSSDQSNSTYLKAAFATGIGDWEKFDVVDAGNGQIALKCVYTGKFVTVDMNQSSRILRADLATSIGAWEPLLWQPQGGGSIALKSVYDGKYVSSDQNSGGNLVAQFADSVGSWEQFTWTDLGPTP